MRVSRFRIGLAFGVALVASAPLSAMVFTVTNTADAGAGSFRQAILAANALPGPDQIVFAIPGGGVHTIAPTTAMPFITEALTIDGTTQSGYTAATPRIELSGASLPAGVDGLRVTSGNTIILGLIINRFQPIFLGGGGNGIVLDTGGGNTVNACFIGTDATGTTALGNGTAGISITSSSGNRIGSTTVGFGNGNLISGNGGVGIVVNGPSSNNEILSNLIGTNLSGTAALANTGDGVTIFGGDANQVNSNILSGNGANGLSVTGSATNTHVAGNRVGIDITGTAFLSNIFHGVSISGAGVTGTHLGGPGFPMNVISGNFVNGVLVTGNASGNFVQGNWVGLDVTGNATLGNGATGISVVTASGNTIGGATAAERNVVSGNGTNGIRLRTGSSNNSVLGNLIGTNAAGTAVLGNTADGVQISDNATNNLVGVLGGGVGSISVGNGLHGVRISDATCTGNTIDGMGVGVALDGVTPMPNLGNGVLIENGASGNTIGGFGFASVGNRIQFNSGAGVLITSGTGNRISSNSISGNGGLGIDLAPTGVTPNDADDSDTGPNQLQNFPILSSASAASGQTHVLGSLTSTVSTTFRVEFFANTACDASGNGEGKYPLGFADVPTNASGIGLIDAILNSAAQGAFITATATDPSGNTSEFSPCVVLPGPVLSSIAPTSGPASGGTTITLTGMQFQSSVTVTVGAVAATSPAGVDDTHATAVTPALAPGVLYDVTLTNLDGLSGTLAKGWLADFTDVPGGHIFHNFVEKLVRKAVTAGCGGGLFCVNDPVTRAQVAVLLLRSHDGPAYVPPPATGTYFTDVPINGFAAAWIEELSRRSVTAGCGGGNYCPTTPITRAQMSVFLLRMKHGPTYVPPIPVGLFNDVPTTSGFARWVEELFNEGITGGCGGGNFCPDAPNTRGQMAVFLVTTFAL